MSLGHLMIALCSFVLVKECLSVEYPSVNNTGNLGMGETGETTLPL